MTRAPLHMEDIFYLLRLSFRLHLTLSTFEILIIIFKCKAANLNSQADCESLVDITLIFIAKHIDRPRRDHHMTNSGSSVKTSQHNPSSSACPSYIYREVQTPEQPIHAFLILLAMFFLYILFIQGYAVTFNLDIFNPTIVSWKQYKNFVYYY